MNLKLTDKVALVTGASSGAGVVIAEQLAHEGAAVVIHGRDAHRAEQVAAAIRSTGGRAAIVTGSLDTQDEANRILREAQDVWGQVDILVCNAGAIGNYETWEQATDSDWAKMYDGVVLLNVRVIKALLPHIRERGWGRIVTISSAQSGQPFAMMPDYAAAKLALHNMTVSLSKHLDRTGITANTVSPGIIVTSRIRERMTETARKEGRSTDWTEIEQHVLRTELDNPTGRLASPEDVAYVVAFLCSPLAGYINGANIRVDGGSNVTVNP